MFSRRQALLGGGLLLAGCAPTAPADPRAAYTPPPNDPRFAEIEQRIGGRVGVAAWNTGSGEWIGHRRNERFAMCSTFKWALAAGVLHSMQNGGPRLDEIVRYNAGDVMVYSPVTEQHVAEGAMTIEQLCEAAVMVSDNTAANLLLEVLMGPEGFTHFLRANGDGVTRLDRTEPELNENAPGDPRDTTTPDAMARTLQRFLLTEEVLSAPSREKLLGWMIASPTGRERLRAGLPAEWRAGDKTGTGVRGATNDVAVIWPPGRAPIVVACYLSDSERPREELNAAHADVGRIVAQTWS
jgi:beta-lactamase class A